MNNTKLKIKYGQVEFEIEGDSATVAREREQFLNTLPVLFSTTNKVFSTDRNNINTEINYAENNETKLITKSHALYDNINTFFRDKGFETNNDLCLAVSYFLQECEGVESIDSLCIKERLKKAKMAIPGNISLSINQLTKKGYLQPFDNPDSSIASYYVTTDGKDYIEQFVKKDIGKTNKKTTKKKVTKITESRYSSVNKEMLNLENYPSIIDLQSTKDKIMLLFYIFKDNNIGEYFTVQDVIYVMSNVFNEKITRDMVSGQFKNDSSKMYYDKRNLDGNTRLKEYKLLAYGEKYVKDNILSTCAN